MWPPAVASRRTDTAAATDRQPTGSHRPLVEVLVTPDCPHRDTALALVQQVCEPLGGRADIQVIQVPD